MTDCYRCGQEGHQRSQCPQDAPLPPAAPPAKPGAAEKPPWCGRCNSRTRLERTLLTAPGACQTEIIRRCPACSPHPPGCGYHVTPPGLPCQLCIHSVPERAERPYGGPPPRPALPAEPINIWTASIKELTAELAALADPASPRLIGERDETELRSVAGRQAAASRLRREWSSHAVRNP